MIVRKPSLWKGIEDAISEVDAESCKTTISTERTNQGRFLYSPVDLNSAFKERLHAKGWTEHRDTFWDTDDEKWLRDVSEFSTENQRRAIQNAGPLPIISQNQTDFLKARVALEVQFGKHEFVAYDRFVKHVSFFNAGVIDVGIEILPMKELAQEMSTDVPYYERDLLNVLRQGRSNPQVPLILIGVLP